MINPTLISAIELPLTVDEADAQATSNLQRLARTPELQALREEFIAVLKQPIALKGRLNRARKVADQISKAVTPHSACKASCSYCCHIPIALSSVEALVIGESIGVTPTMSISRDAREDINHYHRQPCTFLQQGKCSIYDARPMACRLAFNMSDSPYFCNTAIDPQDSHVAYLNLQDLELAFTAAVVEGTVGDIRDFFPAGTRRKGQKDRRR